ncbi:hypothetical protein [Streptomyces incarnatus]|uniref:hypothetical protein n=1 Tax=Streptomyces incarnatus TaxID=665007 RepID=UPI000AABD1F9|nr:hypothetical protein [Streptomyces incarnatus]
MITTIEPVGSWSWETKVASPGSGLFVRCVRQALDVWAALRSFGLAEAGAQADITVGAATGSAAVLRVDRVPVESPEAGAESVLLDALSELGGQNVGCVTIDLSLPGSPLRSGVPHSVQQLFVVSIDIWPSGATTTTLHTFSDAWLSHDLRGHRQPDVQKENAPRLKAALAAITELIGAPVQPWDPGSHGAPTEYGFEDFPDDDPDLLDSWYMFEVPRRTERLQEKIPQDAPRYEAETSAPVDFVDVSINGRVIGYLWASENGDAAGYEPRTPAGHIAVDAAADWLAYLSQARGRGLSSLEALHEAMYWEGTERSGTVAPGSLRKASSPEEVQDLSGRE